MWGWGTSRSTVTSSSRVKIYLSDLKFKMRMKVFKIILVTLQLSLILFFPAFAKDEVQGESAAWESYWYGQGYSTDAAFRLPRAGGVMAKALNAANKGNFPLFCNCFWGIDTNQPPAQLKSWYDEWARVSQDFYYLIGQEAVLPQAGSLSNSLSAVSIAPSRPLGRQPGQKQKKT